MHGIENVVAIKTRKTLSAEEISSLSTPLIYSLMIFVSVALDDDQQSGNNELISVGPFLNEEKAFEWKDKLEAMPEMMPSIRQSKTLANIPMSRFPQINIEFAFVESNKNGFIHDIMSSDAPHKEFFRLPWIAAEVYTLKLDKIKKDVAEGFGDDFFEI